MTQEETTLLARRAAELEHEVEERLVDDHGVIYASINHQTGLPWAEQDWSADDEFLPVEGFQPWEVLNYENCGMTTGAYLAAQAYQSRVTGAPQAYARARRSFAGLQHIYNVGSQKEAGYFPKIYGGRLSNEISSDQYLYAIKGMMAWEPIAPPEDRRAIAVMVSTMVDFWVRREYRYDYFSHKGMQWPTGRFPCMLYAAYALTGKATYLQEARRLASGSCHQPVDSQLLVRAHSGAPYGEVEERFGRGYYGIWIMECSAMDIMGLDECLQRSDDHRDAWLKAMALSWEEGQLSLAEDGLAYACTFYEPSRQEVWHPDPQWLHDGPDPLDWSFLRWSSRFQTPRSTMLARAGLAVAKWLPHLQADAVISKVLCGVSLPQMRHCLDQDGAQILPQHRYMLNWVDSDALVNWLWAYWQWRYEAPKRFIEMHSLLPKAL